MRDVGFPGAGLHPAPDRPSVETSWRRLSHRWLGVGGPRGRGAEPAGRVLGTGHPPAPAARGLWRERRRGAAGGLPLQLRSAGRNAHLRLSGSSPGVLAWRWRDSVYGFLFLLRLAPKGFFPVKENNEEITVLVKCGVYEGDKPLTPNVPVLLGSEVFSWI